MPSATTASGNLASTIKPLDTSRLPGLQSLLDHAQDDAASADATLADLDGDLLANAPATHDAPAPDHYRIHTFAEWRTQTPSAAQPPALAIPYSLPRRRSCQGRTSHCPTRHGKG